MAISDLFSKRQKRLRGEIPEVYKYDIVPHTLRVQIVHIIHDVVGRDNYSGEATQVYSAVNDVLCREYGVFELVDHSPTAEYAVLNFFLAEKSVEKVLDFIELFFRAIDTIVRQVNRHNSRRKMEPDEAIAELNSRFREHGVGFQFESRELIRVDSEFVHAEAVKPTLALLRGKGYEGANEEFLKAHEHYRHGRYKESLVDALKAFESTLKAICMKRGWNIQATATAKSLISTCMGEGLFPGFLESQMSSVRSLLESGLPTVRNKLGGHGQGPETVVVPEYLARYALNLAASSILLAVEANAAKS